MFSCMCSKHPTSAKPFFAFLTLVALGSFAGCGRHDSPDAQVRSVVESMELAAEERDVSGVLEHVSRNYRDDHGNGPDELGRMLRGYFIANQSIRLLSRIDELTFAAEDEARVKVVLATVSRDAAATNAWDLAADLEAFEIVLIREDGEWKVNWARRQGA